MKIPRKAPCPSCGAKRRTVAGADLRKAREKAGLTLRQLGAQAFPAFSPSYLSEIETGAKPPTEAVVTLYESLAQARRPEEGGEVSADVKPGDYVLATKWGDGDPGDQFAVGFYHSSYDHFGSVRHLVVDGAGQQFRANGFRRVKRISAARGAWLIAHYPEIEKGSRSLWWWCRQKMAPSPSLRRKEAHGERA